MRRTNAVWLTQGAFAGHRLRIRRLRSMSFYLSMASYLPDFYADGSTYAVFSKNTTGLCEERPRHEVSLIQVSVESEAILSIFRRTCRSCEYRSSLRFLSPLHFG